MNARVVQGHFEKPYVPALARFEHAAKPEGRFTPLCEDQPLLSSKVGHSHCICLQSSVYWLFCPALQNTWRMGTYQVQRCLKITFIGHMHALDLDAEGTLGCPDCRTPLSQG